MHASLIDSLRFAHSGEGVLRVAQKNSNYPLHKTEGAGIMTNPSRGSPARRAKREAREAGRPAGARNGSEKSLENFP